MQMRLQEGHERGDRTRRERSWRYAMTVAAAVLAWSPAWAEEEPARFHDAVKLYEAKKYPEAFALFEVLAKEWDSRAQVLLGSALVHGSVIRRDIPRGIAWLRIAARESNVSTTTRDKAVEQLRVYEPALSGADLIRADAIAGELTAERDRRRSERLDRAFDRLVELEPVSDAVKEGCALDTALSRCRIARADVENRASVCQPPEDYWPGAGDDRKSWRVEEAKYPDRARQYAWEGSVAVAVHVDGSGWVCRATVADGSDIRELDMAALDAVRRWRFSPRLVDGQPTSYVYNAQVRFVLSDYVIKAK